MSPAFGSAAGPSRATFPVLSLSRAVLLWVFRLVFLWLVLLSLGHLCHFLSPWISRGGVWTCPLCSWSPEFSGGYQPVPVFCISGASWSLLCKMAVFPPVFPAPSPPIFLELCDQVSPQLTVACRVLCARGRSPCSLGALSCCPLCPVTALLYEAWGPLKGDGLGTEPGNQPPTF